MSNEREEALRLAAKAGFSEFFWTEKWYANWLPQLVELIRLARQSAPQGEPPEGNAIYRFMLRAASGYEAEQEGVITPEQYEAACRALNQTAPPAQPDVVRDTLMQLRQLIESPDDKYRPELLQAMADLEVTLGKVIYKLELTQRAHISINQERNALLLLMREARDYIEHDNLCKITFSSDGVCDCGFNALLGRIDAALNHQSPLKNEEFK